MLMRVGNNTARKWGQHKENAYKVKTSGIDNKSMHIKEREHEIETKK